MRKWSEILRCSQNDRLLNALQAMQQSHIDRAKFRTAFVLLLVLAISALFMAVAWPFLKPLVLGAMLAGLCSPLYRWLVRLFGGRRSPAAAVTLLIVILLVVGPLS